MQLRDGQLFLVQEHSCDEIRSLNIVGICLVLDECKYK